MVANTCQQGTLSNNLPTNSAALMAAFGVPQHEVKSPIWKRRTTFSAKYPRWWTMPFNFAVFVIKATNPLAGPPIGQSAIPFSE